MKTKLTLLILLLATATFAQTIRRVNADPTVTGTNVYATIQAAHDAATIGDILIVEPGNSVGPLNCSKQLNIYGRGYYLGFNPDYAQLPNKQSNSVVGLVIFNAGSSNSKLIGVEVVPPNFTYQAININGGTSGITISRNFINTNTWINGSASAPISSITISQNHHTGYIAIYGVSGGIVSNIIISNNYIGTNVGFSSAFNSNIVINQNVLGAISAPTYNSVCSNNIVLGGPSILSTDAINSTFNNNATTGTTTIAASVGAANIVVTSLAATQFVNNTGGSPDNGFRIVNGSVLKTAGNTGGEIGMFGGAAPYVQYGIPAVPAVIKLFNTGIGNATTPITATVSAKSNN